MATIY